MTLKARSPLASAIESTHIVLPSDANALGTIFGGQVMAWIDLAAAACAAAHTRCVCVTASMDALHFLAPIRVGDIVTIKAMVTYVHRTSLEVGVRVEARNPRAGDHRHAASAYLTFVALDENYKPTLAAPLELRTREQQRRAAEARKRRAQRIAFRSRKRRAAEK